MNLKRVAQLKQRCHDEQISIKAEIRCGKMIPSLQTIIHLYGVLEEVLQHVEQQREGVNPAD